jgi:hypothetical protein
MLLFRQIHGEKRVHFMEGVLSTVLKTTGYRACLKVKTPTFIMVSTQSHMFWQMRYALFLKKLQHGMYIEVQLSG